MKMTKILSTTVLVASMALASNAQAHDSHYSFNNSCSVNLQNGVTVTPNTVKVFDSRNTLYSIAKDGSMTVNGESIDLTASQQKISADYAQGIRDSVPQVVEIAYGAMELASEGVSTALGAIFQDNNQLEQQVSQIVDTVKEKIEDHINQQGDTFTIGPNGFDGLEDAFDEEFEQQIEKVAMNSMGSIFTLLGEAMSSSDGSFEQRMEAFGERMERMGEQLETAMEAQTEQIESQAQELCVQLEAVDKLETQMQQQIPEFAKMELLQMEHSE